MNGMINPPGYVEQDCCGNCTYTEYTDMILDSGEAKIPCVKHNQEVYVQFICDDYEMIWIGESDGN